MLTWTRVLMSNKVTMTSSCALQPDITAPGVNVLAAYSGAVSPTEEPYPISVEFPLC